MPVTRALRAFGGTDTGRQREVNEDRFHADPARGLFIVIDGVGGQAAGGKAADTALEVLRARFARETGTTKDRVREAITAANNEIHRLGSLRPEWNGMACVVTVAVVEDDRVTVGHVGDTRLFKLRGRSIEKVTHDHSPVGEREDANEISEVEAMRHPRRNEVYRDVGSEPHDVADAEFIEVCEIPLEPDAALLLCSDGLTDLLPSSRIADTVQRLKGEPDEVVRALIGAANDAGGRDNVTVVYVEGEQFAPADAVAGTHRSRLAVRIVMMCLVALLASAAIVGRRDPGLANGEALLPGSQDPATVVRAGGSISEALQRAAPGSTIVVEPGEYRERIRLKSDVRLASRIPRGATIRLPSTESEGDAAVIAVGVSGVALSGFRIVGDAATPLGTGVFVDEATISIADVEISGATTAAIHFARAPGGELVGSSIHDNPGAGLRIGVPAAPRIAHSSFTRNGTSEQAMVAFVIEKGAQPRFSANVFHGVLPASFATLDERARAVLTAENWFIAYPSSPSGRGAPAGRNPR